MPNLRVRLASGLGAAVALLTLSATPVALSTVLPTVLATAAAAPSDTPSSAACVGLVVDPGSGEPMTSCVGFSDGMSGQDVLVAAGRKLTFDKNGFICRIDGYPDSCTSDNTHYWSYYHRASGAADNKWEYSQKGASDYTVHPGESEGWAYQNGTQRAPAAVPYDTLHDAAKAAQNAKDGAGATQRNDTDGSTLLLVVVVLAVVVLLVAGVVLQRLRARGNR